MAHRTIEDRLKDANDKAEEALKTISGGQGTPSGAPGDAGDGGAAPPAAENFEQKYKVLKGKYDKEVPRLYQMANEFETKARLASEELEKLKAGSLQDEGARPIEISEENLTPDLKEFKEEYPDIFKGMLSMLKTTVAPAKPVVKQREKEVQTPAPAQAKPKSVWTEAMYQVLTSKCKNWSAINKNPEFIGWLTGRDRYARKTRGTLLGEAYAAGDVETVANIITDFEEFHINKPNQPDNAEDVAPGSSSQPVGPSSGQQVETVTRAFVAKFYSDVALGKYRGREKEMNAVEAKINQAAAKRAIV